MASGTRFVENPLEMSRFLQGFDGPVQTEMRRRAELVAALARGQVGKRTGRLAASISVASVRRPGGLVWRVGSGNKIALLHHEGTRPHLIQPRSGRIMRFKHRGSVAYARVVHHPGTRPNRYLTDPLRRAV